MTRTASLMTACIILATGCGPDESTSTRGRSDGGGSGGDYRGGDSDVGPVPVHVDAQQTSDATVYATVTRWDFDYGTNVQVQTNVSVEFYTSPPALDLLSYTKGACESVTSFVTASKAGGTEEDVGSGVQLVGSATFDVPFDNGWGLYRAQWFDSDAGPWQAGASYDIVAPGPSRTIEDAVYTTSDPLMILAPLKDAVVDLASNLEVTWEAGDATLVLISFNRSGGTGGLLICASDDDGSFTVPAADLASLPVAGSPVMMRVTRAYTWRLQRGTDVVHMFSEESVGYTLQEP